MVWKNKCFGHVIEALLSAVYLTDIWYIGRKCHWINTRTIKRCTLSTFTMVITLFGRSLGVMHNVWNNKSLNALVVLISCAAYHLVSDNNTGGFFAANLLTPDLIKKFFKFSFIVIRMEQFIFIYIRMDWPGNKNPIRYEQSWLRSEWGHGCITHFFIYLAVSSYEMIHVINSPQFAPDTNGIESF